MVMIHTAAALVGALIGGIATAAEPADTATQASRDLQAARSGKPGFAGSAQAKACGSPKSGPAETALGAQLSPLPPDIKIRRYVVVAGEGRSVSVAEGATSGSVAAGPSAGVPPSPCEDDPTAVYCNTLGRWAVGVVGANPDLILGDDIATTAVAGCNLDRYVIMVTGDVYGDGSGVGPYDVHVALYTACPSAGGSEIRGTAIDETIPDNRTTTIEVTINPAYDIPLPASLYVGVKFSRLKAGTVMGAPATVGFSADFFDSPHAPCWGWVGGFPPNPHSSFYAEIYVRPKCSSAFVGYKNSNHARGGFSPGEDILFADDIRLGVQECEMVAYEVTVEGAGRTDFHLRHRLTDNMIPGTDAWTSTSVAKGPVIKRVDFDPPISVPQDFYIVFETSHSTVGPILSGHQADVGSTEDLYWVYNGVKWRARNESVYSAFDVSIWCAGLPPVGACCDMILTDEGACVGGYNHGDPCSVRDHCPGGLCVGEAVCRELPEMNCPYPDLWEEGAMCESACEGGDSDGQPCTCQADCPGGDCPGPFAHPCGVAACCKPDDTCENLTENDCLAVPPVERFRWWWPGPFCGEGEQRCPFNACIQKAGDCTLPHPEPGCRDSSCCYDVCIFDPFCCQVEWDRLCAEEAAIFCQHPPPNDECLDPREGYGAREVAATSSTVSDGLHASVDEDDPGIWYCCQYNAPGTWAFGTVWYKFVATHTSAQLDTLLSDPPGNDSLIQVFAVGDPSTNLTACSSLIPLACIDEPSEDPDAETDSRICIEDLIPGDIYYVLVGARTDAAQNRYRLTIKSPCPAGPSPANDDCRHATPATERLTPFDLTDATVDCPISDCGGAFRHDIWFDYVATCTGTAAIATCTAYGGGRPVSLAIYEGCDCAPYLGAASVCYEPLVCGESPECGSCESDPVPVDVAAGQCFKIRVGTRDEYTPAGHLTISLNPFDDCNGNGLFDACDIDCRALGGDCNDPCGFAEDCNRNSRPDECEHGDVDGDRDVDLQDWALFVGCMTAPRRLHLCDRPLYGNIEDCCIADMNSDGDVDLRDIAAFQTAFTGR